MHWVIRFMFDALFPAAAGLPGIAECDADEFIRTARREAPALMVWGIVLASTLFMLTPVFTIYVPLPAFLLSRRLLDKHATRLLSSRFYLVRQLMFLPKMMAGFCWGAHPLVRAAMNLPPYAPDPGTWRQQ